MSKQPFAPCPFCGDRDLDVHEVDVKSWCLTCPSCRTTGPYYLGQDPLTALQRWNTRPGSGTRATDQPESLNPGDAL
jgi:hypothetical protein